MMVSEFGFGIMLALAVWARWPRVPWTAIEVVGVGGAILAPILFYPYSKTLLLAVDGCSAPSPVANDPARLHALCSRPVIPIEETRHET